MTLRVPYGYQGNTESLERTREKHQAKYHPEAWRRYEAIIVASDGLLGLDDGECLCGVGGGARTREEQAASYARAPNVFARPDSSFHQAMEWASGIVGAQAVDWVGARGRHDEAWKWLRDNGGLYGIKTFWNVNGEPWHSQMSEIPNSVSGWRAAGRPDPGTWALPGPAPAPPAASDYGLWPLNPSKPAIETGSLGDAVRYAQMVLRDKGGQTVSVDGEFGPQTAKAVWNLQVFFGLWANSKIDKDDWDLLDALVGVNHTAPPPPVTPQGPQIVLTGSYYVQPGDAPWPVEKKVYGGTGANWKAHFTESQFSQPHVTIPLPDLAGVTAAILPGEGPFQTMKRMYPADNVYAPGRLQRFYDLNGGKARVLHPGDVVFLDEA